MLEKNLQNKIIDLIRTKPLTVQEIAQTIDKNWRTADRYVQTIIEETGLISQRTFREGTRGALKIVYWNALEHSKGSAYQEQLLNTITTTKHKEDFSPLDIFQFAQKHQRNAFIEKREVPVNKSIRYSTLLSKANSQILFFSGDLSWTEIEDTIKNTIDKVATKKITFKILARIDTLSEQRVQNLIHLNQIVGFDAIEIRHCQQPLRGIIIDEQIILLKEVLSPLFHRELKEKEYIFYRITDLEWVTWLKKVFFHLFNQSINAQDRLNVLKTIQKEK